LLDGATFGTTSADWITPTMDDTDAANELLTERWSALTK
jgi:putative spermidine/putrescine transport system substrate-binding protein